MLVGKDARMPARGKEIEGRHGVRKVVAAPGVGGIISAGARQSFERLITG
jgi:hypothetical protein